MLFASTNSLEKIYNIQIHIYCIVGTRSELKRAIAVALNYVVNNIILFVAGCVFYGTSVSHDDLHFDIMVALYSFPIAIRILANSILYHIVRLIYVMWFCVLTYLRKHWILYFCIIPPCCL